MLRVPALIALRVRAWREPTPAAILKQKYEAALVEAERAAAQAPLSVNLSGVLDDCHIQELDRMSRLLEHRRSIGSSSKWLRIVRSLIIWSAPVALIFMAVTPLPRAEAWVETESTSLTAYLSTSLSSERPIFAFPPEIESVTLAHVVRLTLEPDPSKTPAYHDPVAIQMEACHPANPLRIESPPLVPGSRLAIRLTGEGESVVVWIGLTPPPRQADSVRSLLITATGCHVIRGTPGRSKEVLVNGSATYRAQLSEASLELLMTPGKSRLLFSAPIEIRELAFQNSVNVPGQPYRETGTLKSGSIDFDSSQDLRRNLREGERVYLRLRGLLSAVRIERGVIFSRAEGQVSQLKLGFSAIHDGMPSLLDRLRSGLREGSFGLAILYFLFLAVSRKDFLKDVAGSQLKG